VMVLAGDIFDHNRVPLAVIDHATQLLGDANFPIIVLPGNHDCLTADSVYRRGGLANPNNVFVLGISHSNLVTIPALDLSLWGRPHESYEDMSPLAQAPQRTSGRQVVLAHGHCVTGPHDEERAWLIRKAELASLEADYVALGHWDRPLRVGSGILAYYSGSPELAQTINLVTFDGDAGFPPVVERIGLNQEAH